jgi:glycosyltransferase involved in cell wall biosynthesis
MAAVISVVATVRDEAGSIDALIASLERQTFRRFELVVADGGSSDDTVARLRQHAARDARLRVLEAPGTNIAQGRNRAIEAATSDVILVADAGVVLPPEWIERLARPLLDYPDLDVVGGFFESAPRSVFELALGATTLPLADEIDPATFNPSSRSIAFRRSAWERAGRYPEWLDYCEDLWFDFELRRAGQRIGFEPRAVVQFRPRTSLGQFFRQYYRYARGDGKAGIMRRRHALRYATYALAAVALVTRRKALLAALGIGALGYCRRPWLRLWRTRRKHAWVGARELVAAAAWVPLLRAVGDAAKMCGFPAGLRWARRHRPA